VAINDLTYGLEQFPVPEDRQAKSKPSKPSAPAGGRAADVRRLPRKLLHLIRRGVESPRRSDQFFRAVAWLKRLGWNVAAISMLMGRYRHGVAAKYAGRLSAEVERVFDKVEYEVDGGDGAKGKDEAKRKQADILVSLASAAELFHTPDSIGFGDIMVDGHRETWKIPSKVFRGWLTCKYFDATGSVPSPNAMNMALGTLEARAQYKTPERAVFRRVASPHYDHVTETPRRLVRHRHGTAEPAEEGIVGEKEARRKDWPGSARAVSGRLRRAATPLRRFGIEIGRERAGHGRARIITVTLDEKLRKFASASSAASVQSMSKTFKASTNKRADGAYHATQKC
jgi:hypothetical protein